MSNNVGALVRSLRESQGLSQKEFGEALSTKLVELGMSPFARSQAQVSLWETGRRRVKLEHLQVMRMMYGMADDDIMAWFTAAFDDEVARAKRGDAGS